MIKSFSDKILFNGSEKNAISVRDGVLEYLGAELGIEPARKVFTVYRSPATIANVSPKMANIPMTDDHVDVGIVVNDAKGSVSESEMIDMSEPSTRTTIAIKNKLLIDSSYIDQIESGKRELSLGYNAELVEHTDYDFEQKNIVPHHLAVVSAGRCGALCSFIDKQREDIPMSELHKAFCDADGAMNLQQIVELASALPEAIKAVPLDKLQEITPALQELVAISKAVNTPEEEEVVEVAADMEAETEEVTDMEQEVADMEGEEEKEEKSFGDSKQFQDAVTAAVESHNTVIDKAKSFVDADYSFTGKSTDQIMRDALATEHSETFADEELSTAFKLLKKTANYAEFGDSKPQTLSEQLKDKEL